MGLTEGWSGGGRTAMCQDMGQRYSHVSGHGSEVHSEG